MAHCKVTNSTVYSCDHYECNEESHSSISGMKYCYVVESHVYGCDHHQCDN